MTKKFTLEKIRAARNELEAQLRIKGISARSFAKLLGVCDITSGRYIQDPTKMRYLHMKKLAEYFDMSVNDVIDIIEYDLIETDE